MPLYKDANASVHVNWEMRESFSVAVSEREVCDVNTTASSLYGCLYEKNEGHKAPRGKTHSSLQWQAYFQVIMLLAESDKILQRIAA